MSASPPRDDALIWNDRGAPSGPQGRTAPPRDPRDDPSPAPEPEPIEETGRITLSEASERFGVSTSSLRKWSRSGEIDGLLVESPRGRRWMVTPGTVATRVAEGRRRRSGTRDRSAPGPEAGAMLVPRAAWDKLMDQLGNLHEAGQQLAEARERAARYETEAAFLRERLTELRAERDELRAGRESPETAAPEPPADTPAGGSVGDLLRSWRRRLLRSDRSGR